jgi:hypothetical protein
MQEPAPVHETIYSGPPSQLDPNGSPADAGEPSPALKAFFVRVFAWITGALLVSAFFASYSDRYDGGFSSLIMGQALWLVIGGMMTLAYLVSRKVGDMPTSVAISILIAYASLQGTVFGWLYRTVYGESLAPIYMCIATVFGLLCAFGIAKGVSLTSARALLTAAAVAPVLALVFTSVLKLQMIAACAACVCSWLLLSLVGYHRDFLADLPSSFEDDPHGYKAAAVGALQIYLDLIVVMIIILQAGWLREAISDLTDKGNSTKRIEL